MKRLKERGLTLIELLVVISIIGILMGVVFANLSQGSAQSRDAERKADLRNMQNALERYKLKYGRYPLACNGPADGDPGHDWNENWSGQIGTNYACNQGVYSGTGEYVVNDIPTTPEVENFSPQFISTLPTDPKLNGPNSGYVYTVSADGQAYKFMALNTVETETVTMAHEFSRCGITNDTTRLCTSVYSSPGSTGGILPPNCTDTEISNDYAVSEGYVASGSYLGSSNLGVGSSAQAAREREYFTEVVRCK